MTPTVMTAKTAIPIVSMQVRIEDTVTKNYRQVPFWGICLFFFVFAGCGTSLYRNLSED